MELPSSIAPGTSATFTFNVIAPSTVGSYNFQWRMVEDNVEWFGAFTTNVAVSVQGQAAAQIYYIHPDHLGTPREITRSSDNQIVWRWDNTEPFGNSQPNEDPSALGAFTYNLRFPGQYFDAETGTHYNYFRDAYDPGIGRYTQSDPIGLEGGLSTYAYVDSRPTGAVDPSGYMAVPMPMPMPPPGGGVRPVPPIPLPNLFPKPPGDCFINQYNALRDDVNAKCKPNPGNCFPCESCASMTDKATKHFACAAARKKMNDTCFRGGDVGHQIERVFRLQQGWICIGLMPTCRSGE